MKFGFVILVSLPSYIFSFQIPFNHLRGFSNAIMLPSVLQIKATERKGRKTEKEILYISQTNIRNDFYGKLEKGKSFIKPKDYHFASFKTSDL